MTNKVSIFLFVSREKKNAEVKDRRILEILQAKDNKIESLEQVCIMFKWSSVENLSLTTHLCFLK